MSKKEEEKIKSISKEEISRVAIDNDHILISYSDGTEETRAV